MVKMVKIFHQKKYGVCLEKVWSKWSRFAKQKCDRVCGTVMVKMVKIFHQKKYGVCLEKVWSKWSRFAKQKCYRKSV